MTDKQPVSDQRFVSGAIEAAIRIAILGALAIWCFQVASPFLVPLVWGVIIAVASHPIYHWLQLRLGGRSTLAALVFTLLGLTLLIAPTVILSATLIDSLHQLAGELQQGTLSVPPPPEGVAQWPLVGERIADVWLLASENLQGAVAQAGPQLKGVGQWLLESLANVGMGILQFVVAIIIAGILHTKAEQAAILARSFGIRLAGAQGQRYIDLAAKVIFSVTQGVLGVAVIQSLIAGVGFVVMGVPAAGFWAFLCLLLGVVQIGAMPIILGVALYVISITDPVAGGAFLIWSIAVGLLDNILKPILLGRGVDVPMFVIFVGAIGGFISTGIIGLFIGAVVMSLGYTLLMAWLNGAETEPVSGGKSEG
ncbi:MAG: AI-2E family transporter [Motiliproteus sp.]